MDTPPLIRIALLLEYDGSSFCGWQTQSRRGEAGSDVRPGVQQVVEQALSAIAQMPITVIAAGRTDAGVHATAQVIHADVPAARPLSAWVRGVNAHLPPTVAVLWAVPVSADFHARFAAHGRHYVYWLENRPNRSALFAGKVGWHHQPLAVEAMQEAALHLLGTHDFSSFRAAECQAKSPVKNLRRFEVTRQGDFIRFACAGDAFLHHMVRNMVGALVWVGCGKRPVGWLKELLEVCDRRRAAPTFAADGLYLCGVDYEQTWQLPPTWREPLITIAAGSR